MRIAAPLFRQRSCCIYLLPFFTIYNSLFKEKENRSRLEKKEKIFQQMYLFALFFTIYKLKGKKIEAGWKRRKWKAEKVGKDISKADWGLQCHSWDREAASVCSNFRIFNLKRKKIESGLKRVKKKIRLRIAVSLSRKRSCICLLSNQWEIIFLHCQWQNNCLFEIMIYFSQSFWKWMVWWGWWGAFDQVWNPLRGFPIIHSSGSELALAVT